MKEKNNQIITKWLLFKNAIFPILIFGVVFGIFMIIVFLTVALFSPEPLPLEQSIVIILGGGLFISLFLIAICSVNPIIGLYQLFRQEKSLKFSFPREMQKNNIVDTNFENDKWFISTENIMIIALNRDYIKKIKKIDNRRRRVIVTLIKFNNKKMIISGSHLTILKFKNWFSQRQ